jgi:hypothetical protein
MLPISVMRELEAIRLDPIAFGKMLEQEPQVDCPVTHHFGPGLYIRSVEMKAGDFLVGHAHKTTHTVLVLSGQAVIFTADGVKQIDASFAPVIFTAGPGHKAVKCLSACQWANIFPNPSDCRDIETLEQMFLDTSAAIDDVEFKASAHQEDREDYLRAIAEVGLTDADAQAISEREELVGVPGEFAWRLSVRNSPIAGKGLFLSVSAAVGETIAPATVNGIRSIAGKYVNHSASPNCKYERIGGETWLVAIRRIEGSKGGSPGDELTVDYRQSVALSLEVSK